MRDGSGDAEAEDPAPTTRGSPAAGCRSVMLFAIGIALYFLLPPSWNLAAFAACMLLGCLELVLWRWRVAKLPVRSGAETMIGAEATVISPCRTRGEVSIDGERWQAECSRGADPSDVVRVVGRKRLVLIVEPLGRGRHEARSMGART